MCISHYCNKFVVFSLQWWLKDLLQAFFLLTLKTFILQGNRTNLSREAEETSQGPSFGSRHAYSSINANYDWSNSPATDTSSRTSTLASENEDPEPGKVHSIIFHHSCLNGTRCQSNYRLWIPYPVQLKTNSLQQLSIKQVPDTTLSLSCSSMNIYLWRIRGM